MKYDRVSFVEEMMNPALALARGNFNTEFKSPEYLIERDGDTVKITSVATMVTVHLPWSLCTGALPARAEPVPQNPQPVKGGKR